MTAGNKPIGVRDRNGKMICEGDMLHLIDEDGDVFGSGIVRWDAESAGFVHGFEEWFDGKPSGQFRPPKKFWMNNSVQLEVVDK